MEKVLISACLVGDKVRYDGKGGYDPLVKELLEYVELVPFCAEVEGGLKTPRPKSEIRRNQVINEKGQDVTRNFTDGAKKGLNIVNYLDIKVAILKEHSPSCGVNEVYDGTFRKRLVKGEGYLTRLLRQHGVRVISSDDISSYLEELKNNQ